MKTIEYCTKMLTDNSIRFKMHEDGLIIRYHVFHFSNIVIDDEIKFRVIEENDYSSLKVYMLEIIEEYPITVVTSDDGTVRGKFIPKLRQLYIEGED